MGISTRLSPSYAVRFWLGWLGQFLRGCTCLKCTNRDWLVHDYLVGARLLGWCTITWLVHLRQVHPLRELDCHATTTWLPRNYNLIATQRQHGYPATATWLAWLVHFFLCGCVVWARMPIPPKWVRGGCVKTIELWWMANCRRLRHSCRSHCKQLYFSY